MIITTFTHKVGIGIVGVNDMARKTAQNTNITIKYNGPSFRARFKINAGVPQLSCVVGAPVSVVVVFVVLFDVVVTLVWSYSLVFGGVCRLSGPCFAAINLLTDLLMCCLVIVVVNGKLLKTVSQHVV